MEMRVPLWFLRPPPQHTLQQTRWAARAGRRIRRGVREVEKHTLGSDRCRSQLSPKTSSPHPAKGQALATRVRGEGNSLPASRSSQPRQGGEQINGVARAAADLMGSEWPSHGVGAGGDYMCLHATGGALTSGSHGLTHSKSLYFPDPQPQHLYNGYIIT